MMARSLLPTLFLSHGAGPAHILDFTGARFAPIDRNSPSAEYLRSLSTAIDQYNVTDKPIECILVVSAHWEEPEFSVEYQTSAEPQLYFDYSNFPAEAYPPYFTYPIKTNLTVADRVLSLLQEHGLTAVTKVRGYDHGVFMPLKVAYPDASIPVVQLSLKDGLSIREHIRLGEILRPLRAEGVLIIGSGQTTHSLPGMRSGDGSTIDPRALEFTEFLRTFFVSVTLENYEEKKQILENIADHAPHFHWAHPRTEHFVPLAVAFGASFIPRESAEVGELSCIPDSDTPYFKHLYHEIAMGYMALDNYMFL